MASTQRGTSGAAYEEFQPNLELTETPEAHILYIHLPGFTREQIKIKYVGSTKALIIYGEKPMGRQKWIRFDEAIPVPANCEVNRLHGKFDKEILTITMPKKFITQVVPKEELRSSEDEISQYPSLGPTYEEFHPKAEKIENPDAYLLQVYLPGFTREQVKIRYVGSTQSLSISGEKPEGGNKWSRFSESIPVPENCEVIGLHGKFDQEILTITMPKKIITPVVPKEELRASEEEISQDPSIGAAYEEFQPKVEKIENLDAYFLQVYLPGFSTDQVNINNDRSSRVINISGERPIEGGKRWSRFSESIPVPENSNEERLAVKFEQEILTIKIPKRVTSLVVPKEVAMVEPKPHSAEKVIPPKPMYDMEGLKRGSSHSKEQKTSKQEISQDPSHEDEKSQNQSVMKESFPIYSGEALPSPRKTVAVDAGKERATGKDAKESYEEPSGSRNSKKDLSGVKEKEIGEGILTDEEKNLLFNRCATAVVVIAAVAAYVSYRFISSEKS